MQRPYKSFAIVKARGKKYVKGAAKHSVARRVRGASSVSVIRKLLSKIATAEKAEAKAEVALEKANTAKKKAMTKLDSLLDSSKKKADSYLSKGEMSDVFGK